MKIALSQSEFCLSKRETLSLLDAAGVRVEAREGSLWLTQDFDRRDVVLRKGESFTLEGSGRAIVQAFEPSRVLLSQPAPGTRSRQHGAAWLREALQRLAPRVAWA